MNNDPQNENSSNVVYVIRDSLEIHFGLIMLLKKLIYIFNYDLHFLQKSISILFFMVCFLYLLKIYIIVLNMLKRYA
jgi:hypothetical protein